MPCPFFQPLKPAEHPKYAVARLPLIEEWDGLCHAAAAPTAVPEPNRFALCNHGYSHPGCGLLPAEAEVSALRYSITATTEEALDVLCIEERRHAPVKWFRLQYRVTDAAIDGAEGECIAAQARAFCQSYLKLNHARTE